MITTTTATLTQAQQELQDLRRRIDKLPDALVVQLYADARTSDGDHEFASMELSKMQLLRLNGLAMVCRQFEAEEATIYCWPSYSGDFKGEMDRLEISLQSETPLSDTIQLRAYIEGGGDGDTIFSGMMRFNDLLTAVEAAMLKPYQPIWLGDPAEPCGIKDAEERFNEKEEDDERNRPKTPLTETC